MKNAFIAIVVSSVLLSGCAIAKPYHEASSKIDNASSVAAPGVADPLHAVKFVGNDYINGKDVPINVSVGNGFTKAMINDEPAKVKRVNANFYEIRGSGYIVSLVVNPEGVESASWNKTKGRSHGGLNRVE